MPFVIAIDGRAASGKTTLAAEIAASLGQSPKTCFTRFFAPCACCSSTRFSGQARKSPVAKIGSAGLSEIALSSSVVHMDDFFLPPEMRTTERLDTPGGNIHHERFLKEILPHIKEASTFFYNVFDCGVGDFNGVREAFGKIRIVEGAYSCHPIFGQYADLRIFCDVSPDEQITRIVARNGQKAAQVFQKKWIPMEEKYLEYYQIKRSADIVYC